jgi:hypothetical protein
MSRNVKECSWGGSPLTKNFHPQEAVGVEVMAEAYRLSQQWQRGTVHVRIKIAPRKFGADMVKNGSFQDPHLRAVMGEAFGTVL